MNSCGSLSHHCADGGQGVVLVLLSVPEDAVGERACGDPHRVAPQSSPFAKASAGLARHDRTRALGAGNRRTRSCVACRVRTAALQVPHFAWAKGTDKPHLPAAKGSRREGHCDPSRDDGSGVRQASGGCHRASIRLLPAHATAMHQIGLPGPRAAVCCAHIVLN
jgi:hypothetical protein